MICIINPSKNAYSETFIAAHFERLPFEKKLLTMERLGEYHDENKFLIPIPFIIIKKAIYFLGKNQTYIDKNKADRWINKINEIFFYQYLKKNKIKAILAEYGFTGVEFMEACNRSRVPLIVHFHGYDASVKELITQYKEKYQLMFQKANAIIVVSKEMEGKLINLGAPRQKLFYNPYGVDCTIFKKTNPDKQPIHYVAVGRFVEKKAPYLTILAFKQVVDIFPEAQLTMIGDGYLWGACKQLVDSLQLSRNISLPGPLSHTDVAEAMQRSRAFVQHSIQAINGDSEGTPVAVLEAGASGLPVVATNHAGIKDVVIHGETGFLVNEGDINGMAAYMMRLAKEPETAAIMGQKARERIKANFSMEKSINQLAQIISNAIAAFHKI